MPDLATYYLAVARWVLPVLALFFLFLLKRLLIWRLPEPPLLAVLTTKDGQRFPVTTCEASIGRGRGCEIHLPLRTVSRQHAVLVYRGGGFQIRDTRSKGGVRINGKDTGGVSPLRFGDIIELGGIFLTFEPPEGGQALFSQERDIYSGGRIPQRAVPHPEKQPSPVPALTFLSLFQGVALVELLFTREEYTAPILLCFCGLTAVQWAYCLISKQLTDTAPGPEVAAFFLTTLGLCVTASAAPGELVKQFIAVLLGIVLLIIMSLILSNLKLVMRLRYAAGIGALLLLIVNLIIGEVRYGAQNWINFGLFTVQPSEFIKIAFIFAGAVTLDWMMTRRNLIMLMLFSAACIGMLFLMEDFGTALIFFVTFLMMAYLSSGNLPLIGGICAAAAAGAAVIVQLRPYILRRFAAWRRVFEYANSTGYQQTRTLIAISGGGLLGLGGGNGFLRNVVASDTDLAFGIVCEEWGFIVAVCSAVCLLLLLAGVIHHSRAAVSSYYAISACAAAGLFLFQSSLNLFGSTDILPLTGVTYVFVSNGGSSMVACWGILAFIKALYRHRIHPGMAPKEGSLDA